MPTDGILKDEVRSLLRYGKENALKGQEIATTLKFKNDRLIRHAIRELIAEGLPVASSVSPPWGYFIVSSFEEATEYMKVLKGRLVQDAYRLRDFKLDSRKLLQPYQITLI